MPTGYEVDMYRHIGQIASHLNRIANCLEANEKRQRQSYYAASGTELAGVCSEKDCLRPVIAMVSGVRYCQEHMRDAFIGFATSIEAGTEDLEQAIKEGK
jgi:hypothetical protein